ncbi:MAG: sigma-54 dependent transcriptional regulator [Puniceicoccaceae bacterium]
MDHACTPRSSSLHSDRRRSKRHPQFGKVTVQRGGLPENLFESELFGHVKGAFTDARSDRMGRYELADGGTLFLDEIGNLCFKHQATLLRLLESGEFERLGSSKTRTADVRLICATNANLAELVRNGSFREDLYYRINTVPVHIPPLRERPEDILPLAEAFLTKYRSKYGKPLKQGFSATTTTQLRHYSWPGNVRELEHVVERAVLLSRGDEIEPANLGLHSESERMVPDSGTGTLAAMERKMLLDAISRFPGDPNQAAEQLGITRSSLYRRIHKYHIPL